MANPLARVIMDNIAKKSQGGYVNKNNRIDGGNLTRQDENHRIDQFALFQL